MIAVSEIVDYFGVFYVRLREDYRGKDSRKDPTNQCSCDQELKTRTEEKDDGQQCQVCEWKKQPR